MDQTPTPPPEPVADSSSEGSSDEEPNEDQYDVNLQVVTDNDLMRAATLLIFLLMLSTINGNNEGSVIQRSSAMDGAFTMCIPY